MPLPRAGCGPGVEPGAEVLPAIPRGEPALTEQPTGSGERLSSGPPGAIRRRAHPLCIFLGSSKPSQETRALAPLGPALLQTGGQRFGWVARSNGQFCGFGLRMAGNPTRRNGAVPVCALQMWLQGQVPRSFWTGLHSTGRDLWSWLDGSQFNQALRR